MAKRFTLDGSPELETRLGKICLQVRAGLLSIFSTRAIEAVALGGGYGRGEGGVWKTDAEDRPYNDLEFYVFLRGNRLLHDYKYSQALRDLGERLSPEAGAHVEFKIESAARLKRTQVSMFSYDLVAGHRVIFGRESIFDGCEHHLDATKIPLAEGTRLLCNRCSGLLLAEEMLDNWSEDSADFVGRNLAKVRLALGDAALTAFGQYHWSVRERHRRLSAVKPDDVPPWLGKIQAHHAGGLVFKLHPRPAQKSRADFVREHREISLLAAEVWLWLESRRLNRRFESARDYALSEEEKRLGGAAWRNFLLTLRTFGPKGALSSLACRYPRERLFNTLPLLLWNSEVTHEPQIMRRLQKELQTEARDRTGFLSAYKQLWPSYG
ncbi:MAG TPA: hypothetical protein VGN61_05640 [Verrucomicrobiae bacterium]